MSKSIAALRKVLCLGLDTTPLYGLPEKLCQAKECGPVFQCVPIANFSF
jgi:hypothetical protein